MPKFPTTRASLISDLGDPGNTRAWADFSELYQPVIYRMARAKGLQHADAEDLTQEVLVKVSKSAASWNKDKNRGSFRGWLHVVMRNLVIQRFGRKGVIARATEPTGGTGARELGFLPDDRDGLSEIFELESKQEAFRIAGRRVRPEFSDTSWQAFWKTWIDEQPVKKVAEELGMSEGAVYVARSRVMRRLRDEAANIRGDLS